MKKKNLFIIVGVILVIIIFFLAFWLNNKPQKNSNSLPNNDFISLTRKAILDEESHLFTNYDDFYNTMRTKELSAEDFQNNNYVFFKIIYNTCSETEITPVSYLIDGENINITINYIGSCDSCVMKEKYYALKVDKSMTKANVNLTYHMLNTIECEFNEVDKPIIYLYPKEQMPIKVQVGYPDNLTLTYPPYNNGWEVLAKPDGNLLDKQGRTFYGLYWEGLTTQKINFTDGFVVNEKELLPFLEEKLAILGLNEREANEFIIYWLPILAKNKYNLIRFETLDNINAIMPLYITPKPDTIIRILMEYQPLEKKVNIKEQSLSSPTRTGYTVVEWGGTKVN